jgi:Zn ribbon nucleic-acid-binding protein
VLGNCKRGRECKHMICGTCRNRQILAFLDGEDIAFLECIPCRMAGASVVRNHIDSSLVKKNTKISFFFEPKIQKRDSI